jgi:non-canonical purine NTP pyrophosphatase (RdgB/HAM1 family)
MFNPSCLTHSGLLHRSQWMPACCEPLPPEDRRTPFSRTPISRTTQTRLVIASGNPHKVAEIAAMLEMVELEVLPQPAGLEIEETGSTYAANARLKAETVARLTGCWALADDSGLEVDALGDRPGLYSARYAPSDPEKIHRLLHELGDGLYRGGRFVSAMALADPDGITRLEGCGICHGTILREPQGNGGGYDPIFWVREAGCSYAQMSAHLKSKLGSRGKAARQLAPALRQLLGLDG